MQNVVITISLGKKLVPSGQENSAFGTIHYSARNWTVTCTTSQACVHSAVVLCIIPAFQLFDHGPVPAHNISKPFLMPGLLNVPSGTKTWSMGFAKGISHWYERKNSAQTQLAQVCDDKHSCNAQTTFDSAAVSKMIHFCIQINLVLSILQFLNKESTFHFISFHQSFDNSVQQGYLIYRVLNKPFRHYYITRMRK